MCISDAAVRENTPRVQSIAGHWARKLPSTVMYDDLVQIGWEAVFELAAKHDPDTIDFKMQVAITIKRQIIDHLRGLDHMPRLGRGTLKKINTARDRLEHRLNHKPTDREIAKEAGVDLDTYFWLLGSEGFGHESGTDFYGDDHNAIWLAETVADPHLTSRELHSAVEALDEQPRRCIKLKYYCDLSDVQVGAELGVSGSRISQIHKVAIQNLRKILRSKESWR